MTQTISRGRKTRDGSTGSQLMEELGALMVGERAAFVAYCRARAMTMAHVFLMSKIHDHGPVPMTRVAELLGSSLPTATGFVSRMEERGLVRREHDTRDRRVVLVTLTEAGTADVNALNLARQRRMTAAIAQLPESEQRNLLAGIQSLRSALRRLDEGDDAP